MRSLLSILFFLICGVVLAQQKRVALIIGNEKYEGHFSPLHTPVNDAIAMKNVLGKLGYETIIGTNIQRDSMSIYLKKFRELAKGAEVALFYYSGHAGIDNKKEEYLAPSGSYNSQATLTEECYSFEAVQRDVKRIDAPIKFFIIDACRNSIDDSKGKVPDFSMDNLKKNVSKVKGSICWYATSINQTAKTGSGKYSLFTESLLTHLGSFDNVKVTFDKISEQVSYSVKDQIPHYTESEEGLSSKVYLNPNKVQIYTYNWEGEDIYFFSAIPSDAKISVGGTTIKSGDPLVLKYGQEYDVEISAEGYETINHRITATPYKTIYKDSLVKSEKTILSIICNRDNAYVFFDSKFVDKTPLLYNINTYAGFHDIRVESKGYYSYNTRARLGGGNQTYHVELKKNYPWFWRWHNEDGIWDISYHYSPENPIGIGFMWRPEDDRISYGIIAGFSTGLFRGLGNLNEVSISISTSSTSSTTSINGATSSTGYTETSYSVDGRNLPYSSYVDPYNEAEHYNASFVVLANVGYNLCNGIMLEGGFGAGYHADRYYMDHTYSINSTIRTDLVTGEQTRLPDEYVQQSNSKWYIESGTWSPALRLGSRFIIPLSNNDDNYLSFGGGYTYLFNNHEYSIFDVNVGFAWSF